MNEEKLIELKSAMEAETKINEEITEVRTKFEEEHLPLFKQQNKIREQISGCKEILCVEAEEEYKVDGIKKRLGGIGIRIYKLLEYDQETALKWAKDKDLFLQLDKKAFENVAKTGEIDFVTSKDKITVTFPKEIKINEEEE